MGKKVSLKDIADKVGVSTALVSYVLNGLEKEKRVGAEVVTKIKNVARDLNYKPNQIARSLRKGSTNTIGLIVADIANPFFAQLARIIEDEASRYNYVVIIGSSDEDCFKSGSLVETFLDRQVDGFIIVPSHGCAKQVVSLVEKEVPVVLIDRYFPEVNTSYIILDNFRATYDATSHLINQGYKKIEMIAYRSSMIHMQERVRGYRQAMKDHSFGANAIQVREVNFAHAGEEMGKIMTEIAKKKKTEAVIFANNGLSIAGLYAIRSVNIKIPDELAVIGFDGNEAFDFFDPPITYIEQPLEEMGKESARVLIEQVKGSNKTVHVELKPRLVQRGSCRKIF